MKHCWGIQPWAALYEGFVIENLIAHARGYTPPFYRSAEGAELDLVLQEGSSTIALEVKASSPPPRFKEVSGMPSKIFSRMTFVSLALRERPTLWPME